MRIVFLSCLLILANSLFAGFDGNDTVFQKIKINGYLDIFYAYDFSKPTGNQRQPFLYNHNRHNEFNLNLGFIRLAMEEKKYRANLALQSGTYVEDNYASEPQMYKNIFEANAGISLNNKNTLWMDVGVFSSHIGFESAISAENWTLTRSLLAENSPYFLSGMKFTYNFNQYWEAAALVCNGWQRIQRLTGNSLPGFGSQLSYNQNENLLVNWSTFIGTDNPDSNRTMRYFNNLYAQVRLNKRIDLITGFDFGFQQKEKNSTSYDNWLSPVLIMRYIINEKWKSALRVEYFEDKNGVIIILNTLNGFRTSGLSLNIDYQPKSNVFLRIEGRWLNINDAVGQSTSLAEKNNYFLVASCAVKFGN